MIQLNWKRILTATAVVAGVAIAAACSSTTVVNGDGGTNCGTGSQQCGDTCTVVARDPQNCGTCGKACAAGEVCSQGACASACGGGTTKCGNECVDTKSDGRNCGACGTACKSNEVCMAGMCATACAMGTTKCGMSCVSTQTDRTNCGMCGNTCAQGLNCVNGSCTLQCQQGQTSCPVNVQVQDGGADGGGSDAGGGQNVCVDLQTDKNNCGMCGKVCNKGEGCANGTCGAVCGDGILSGNEKCDDGNNIDVDACKNDCTLGALTIAGNGRTYAVNAATGLGEVFTNYSANQWLPANNVVVLIEANDGASAPPDYSTPLNAGAHILLIGGSGLQAYTTEIDKYVATDKTFAWHQSSGCTADWIAIGNHPAGKYLPATIEFSGNQSVSYHMLHFAAQQPMGTTLFGRSCEGNTNYVAVSRTYSSGGTFTYMALDVGNYTDTTVQSDTTFVRPLIKGWLEWVRGPH